MPMLVRVFWLLACLLPLTEATTTCTLSTSSSCSITVYNGAGCANAGSTLTLTSVGTCFYSTDIATLINQTGFSVISSPTSCNDLTIWTNANCARSNGYPSTLGFMCTTIQITPYVSISATSTCPAGITTDFGPNPSPSPISDPVDCSACPSWCFASPRASPSPSPTPVPSPSPSPLCGCNPLGPLDPWAFQLVALGPVGSPGNPVVAYFGGAVLLSAPSFVDFQNINGDVISNTLGTALVAAADVTFSGTSSSNMDLEVQGNLTNDGYWRGNVYVGGALVNDGVIQGNALSGNGCTDSCGPPQVSGTNTMGMDNPAVSVVTVQQYYSCLSLSVASLAPTVNFVSCSPTVAPTTCALAVSPGRNIANMYFSGITSIGIVGGDATTVLFLNVLDGGSVTYPATWSFMGINPSAVIVNVLHATALSGSVFHTPVIAQLATLTSTTTNVTAHSTMVVNSLAADITYYFSPTPTSINTNALACYQS